MLNGLTILRTVRVSIHPAFPVLHVTVILVFDDVSHHLTLPPGGVVVDRVASLVAAASAQTFFQRANCW